MPVRSPSVSRPQQICAFRHERGVTRRRLSATYALSLVVAAEIGCGIVLALLDDRAADRAGLGEHVRTASSPSPQRIARWSASRSSVKRCSISSTASLLARNTSRHMVGVGRGDAREIAEAAGRDI